MQEYKRLTDPEESIDDGDQEENTGEPCPSCNGEGITYVQGDYDEEDKDFKQCPACGGSGVDPESVTYDEEDTNELS